MSLFDTGVKKKKFKQEKWVSRLEAVRELKALGVGVCFEEQGIDTSELAGEFLPAIFAMMDQKESENIADNLRWSIDMRMRAGKSLFLLRSWSLFCSWMIFSKKSRKVKRRRKFIRCRKI